jgi:hypothetical protein
MHIISSCVPSSTSSHITVVAVDVVVEVTDAVDCVVSGLRIVSRGLRAVVVVVVIVTGSPGVLGPSSVQAQGVCSLDGSRGSMPGVHFNLQAAQYSCFL